MFKTVLRNLAGHKLRLLTTGLAVMLGVAFMAGTLVLTDTLEKTFDDLFADVYETTDAVVRGEAAFDDPSGMGEQRARIDASVLDVVSDVDGVAAAEGGIFGFAQLIGRDGKPVNELGTGPPSAGGSWSYVDELNTFTLVSGAAPATDDEIVIDKRSADEAGYAVGDTATVVAKGGPAQFRVAGVVKFGEADSPAGASFVLFTMPTAQRLVAEPAKFDTISVVAQDGVTQAEIAQRIERVLPSGVEAITGEAATAESQDVVAQAMSFFSTFMLVFAVVALLVGGFMIFNTFFITVAQRTRENALLRAIGASRRQVLASILFEAVAVGVVASLAGLAGGVAVASGLKGLLDAAGFDLPSGAVVFTSSTAVMSFLAGLSVTVIAAVSPARKAGKVPPIAAMRDVAVGSAGYGSKQRVMIGSGILISATAILLYGLFGATSNAMALVGAGMLFVFFGVSVLGRTIALPVSRVIGWPLPRLRGIAGNLARENAMRNPKRTAATASALMIGVGLVVFFSIIVASTKASFNAAIDKSLTGDLVVTSGAVGFGGLDPTLSDRLNELTEVDVAAGMRVTGAEINGSVEYVNATDPARSSRLFDIDPAAGTLDDLDVDGIGVSEDVADEDSLSVGDAVTVRFRDTGTQEMTVAVIYRDDVWEGDWLLGLDAYEANVDDQYDSMVFVKLADGVDTAAATAAVERAADEFPGAKVLDQTEYKKDQLSMVDQLLGVIYAMLGLAILIALLGIGNTLALSILERTREVGVLRAVGMTRSQLRAAIRWESVIIAIQGALTGLLVGAFLGWALVTALAGEGLTEFAVPVATMAAVVVLAALAGVVAAVLPARRAAKLNILGAIASE